MKKSIRRAVGRFSLLASLMVGLLSTVSARATTLRVSVTDKTGAPVADAAVYAEAVGAKPVLKPRKAKINQVDMEFDPTVNVVQVGTAVSFPNRDSVRHHVYSFSPAKAFELKLYSGQKSKAVTFDKPGVVALGCNIHDWMVAYVVAVDTPYFGKTDAAGKVTLDGLPPGDYDLKLWQYRASAIDEITAAKRVTISAAPTAASFVVELKRGPARPVAK